MQQTTNFNFNLPEESDVARTDSREGYNSNFEDLDEILENLTPFNITFERTYDTTPPTTTSDKTFTELEMAISNHRTIFGNYEDRETGYQARMLMSPYNSSLGRCSFYGFLANVEELTVIQITFNSNNQVYVHMVTLEQTPD